MLFNKETSGVGLTPKFTAHVLDSS